MNRAIYLRGLFLHRYTGIEFSISALIVAAREHPAYNHFGDLPYRFDSKLKRFEELISAPGPLSPNAFEYRDILDHFAAKEEVRHFMAHAMMAKQPDNDDIYAVRFALYTHKGPAIVHVGHLDMTTIELDQLVSELAPHAANFATLVARDMRRLT